MLLILFIKQSSDITNHWREIFDPDGSNISQLSRYIHRRTFK